MESEKKGINIICKRIECIVVSNMNYELEIAKSSKGNNLVICEVL